MTIETKIKSHSDVVGYFKELPFYNKYIEKPKINRLKGIDLLSELSFYEELSLIKTNAFNGYAMSCKFEITEKKDPIKQLESSKSSIKNLFRDFLSKTKGFKYQITLKVTLRSTSQMKKFNLDQFISIQQFINLVLANLVKRFCTGLMTGLMKDLFGLLNQSILNTLTFQLTDHY